MPNRVLRNRPSWHESHRCKKRFIYVFNVFLFSKRFLYFYLKKALELEKVQSGKLINKKHFQNNSNEIDIGLGIRRELNNTKKR